MKTLVNPIIEGLGAGGLRKPETECAVQPPSDWAIVSSDNHIEVTDDIFYENFPQSMKDRAPRVTFDRMWKFALPGGQGAFDKADGDIAELWNKLFVDVKFEKQKRDVYMREEGVDQEIAFPNSLLGLLHMQDREARELVFRIYNEYVVDLEKQSDYLFGVGVLSNWWDETKVEKAVQQIGDLGLKTFMLPIALRDLQNKPMGLADESMDRFWSAAEELGLPVNFHIGENNSLEGRGGFAANYMNNTAPFRKPLAQLVFGGVFDRHPNLKVVFTEAGISWVPHWLQDAEYYYDTHLEILDIKLKHRPSYYWANNCYATFQLDQLGLNLIDYIGSDRVMWASDYPHSESVYGAGRSSIRSVMDAVSPSEAKAILGGTAAEIYNLPPVKR